MCISESTSTKLEAKQKVRAVFRRAKGRVRIEQEESEGFHEFRAAEGVIELEQQQKIIRERIIAAGDS